MQGIFLAFADKCSELECQRDGALSLKTLKFKKDALAHDSAATSTLDVNSY